MFSMHNIQTHRDFQSIALTKDVATIGCDQDNTVVLPAGCLVLPHTHDSFLSLFPEPDTACALHHCDVVRNTTRCNTSDPLAFILDRSRSCSGTFRNGTRVRCGVYQPLDTGDVISFSPPKDPNEAQAAGEEITLVFYSASETTVSEFQKDYYVFGKTLGSGTSADVRKCRERRTGKCFAVKIVHLTKFTSTKFLSRIESEVPMLEKVNHPNIVKFIRRYRDSSALYIVLELFVFFHLILFFLQECHIHPLGTHQTV